MDKKHQNIPPKSGFSSICDPQDFFSKIGLYGALTSCKKLEKTNEQSLRYLKTDTHTDGQGRLLRTPSGKPGVQNKFEHPQTSILSLLPIKIFNVMYFYGLQK